jgi:hypothetical protein
MFLKTKEEMYFEKNGPNSPDFKKIIIQITKFLHVLVSSQNVK